MRKFIPIAGGAAGLAAAIFYAAPFQSAPPQFDRWFPSGALLYLEARDFSGELHDWNNSQVQQRWAASTAYETFARSNLFLKLTSAGEEFAGAAGGAPDGALLESVAGRESALALYDIGNLEFLYVTHLAAGETARTVLGQARARYETRHAGNSDFYVRTASGRTVAFAATPDYLILGTREELVAGALRLMAGEALTPLAHDPWFADAVGAAGAAGELRLVLNPDALVKTPQFRSYWIERNASEVRRYRAAIADVTRAGGEIREERTLLRAAAAPAVAGAADDLMHLAPDNAAFCRSVAQPPAEEVTAWMAQKLLAPKVTGPMESRFAPQVMEDGEAGSESDLETRIDEAPVGEQSALVLGDLGRVLAAQPLTAALEVQSGEALPDGVFVTTPAALAIAAAGNWDGDAVRRALSTAAASVWTVSGLGTGWSAGQRGAQTWYALAGPAPLALAVDGNLLVVSNSPQLLGQLLERRNLPATRSGAAAIALYRHQAARDDYRRLMNLLDHSQGPQEPGRGPAFFSGEMGSLSDVLGNLREAQLTTRDSGSVLRESAIYRLR